MICSKEHEQFATTAIVPYVEKAVNRRKRINAPSEVQMKKMMGEIVENAIVLIEEGEDWMENSKASYRDKQNQDCCPTCGSLLSGLGYVYCNYCDNFVGVTEY